MSPFWSNLCGFSAKHAASLHPGAGHSRMQSPVQHLISALELVTLSPRRGCPSVHKGKRCAFKSGHSLALFKNLPFCMAALTFARKKDWHWKVTAKTPKSVEFLRCASQSARCKTLDGIHAGKVSKACASSLKRGHFCLPTVVLVQTSNVMRNLSSVAESRGKKLSDSLLPCG